MKLTDYFDRTHIINLPCRKDRLWMIKHELKRAGIKLLPGKVEIFRGIRPEDPGVFPNAGVRGCFLSHLSILRQARKDNLKNVLIMEDDLAISDFFIKNEEKIVENLRSQEWGVVYLGHILKLGRTTGSSFEPYEGRIWTAHWYGISGRILGPLVAFLEQWEERPDLWQIHKSEHVDGAFSVFRQSQPACLTLVSNPCLGWQKGSRSDIFQNKFFDKIPLIKNLAAGARIAKSLLIRKRRIGW